MPNPVVSSKRLARARPSRQRGLGLVGLIFILFFAGIVGLIGLQSFPAWQEYIALKRICHGIETSGAIEPAEIRESFEKQASIAYVTAISSRDLEIVRTSTGVKIGFGYESRVPLFANVFLLYEFER